MNFIEILNDLLIECNLTQSEAAKLIGVKPSQVSEWLKGKAKPGYDTLRMMATNLNVSTEYLLGLDENFCEKSYVTTMHQKEDEQELIELYRTLSPMLKNTTLDTVRTWAGKKLPKN